MIFRINRTHVPEPKKKKKKLNVVREDRISKLPDPLLHHILSFLPTECAVSTTVLSKRWKNVWISVPVLDFRNWNHEDGYEYSDDEDGYEYCDEEDGYDYHDDKQTTKFMDYVDRVLVQRNMLNINKFCLNCENEYFDLKRVNAWITTAGKCQVKEFIFSWRNSHPSNDEVMPDSLFTCQSLTTLDFQFPELGVLKILRLTNVAYEDQKSAGKLFSSCPVLEELCLTDCGWENVQFIRISAPRLKSFTLNGCLGSYMESARVKIDAPNLLSFTFCDWLPEDFVVDSFPLLQDAFLYYNYGDIESRFLP
ncbi:F-box/LRR-repeat protein At3g59200-like [Papaver somniferum]|uniref:F-box/LRR-repeat protein At3g59200-like n=1 Tax=Papaver somniferum TaxID=3469 RepID=UPI000E6F4EAE|nr:F-box/LRR-repeat protein At3g59200-like [Papaver somniferum]